MKLFEILIAIILSLALVGLAFGGEIKKPSVCMYGLDKGVQLVDWGPFSAAANVLFLECESAPADHLFAYVQHEFWQFEDSDNSLYVEYGTEDHNHWGQIGFNF